MDTSSTLSRVQSVTSVIPPDEHDFEDGKIFFREEAEASKNRKESCLLSLSHSIGCWFKSFFHHEPKRSEKGFSSSTVFSFIALFFSISVALAATLTTYFVEHASHNSCETLRNTQEELVSRFLVDEIGDYLEKSNYSIAVLYGLSSGLIDAENSTVSNPRDMFYFVSERMSNQFNKTELNFFRAPNGSISDVYPSENEWLIGENVFTRLNLSFIPPFFETDAPRLASRFVTTFSTDEEWSLVKVSPLYDGNEPSQSPLWGVIGSFVSLESLPFMSLQEEAEEFDTDYLMALESDDGTYYLINTSVAEISDDPSNEVIKDFIDGGSASEVDGGMLRLLLVTRSKSECLWEERFKFLLVAEIIFSILLFFALMALIRCSFRGYDAFRYAPKAPPFALLKIGPQYAQELWNLAPEEMRQAAYNWSHLLDTNMKQFHAYPLSKLQQHTTTFVFQSVSEAVQMATHVLQELSGETGPRGVRQRHRIDEELVQLLGEDGKFTITCVIHWCTDATVTTAEQEEIVHYKGSDLLLGSKLWFGAPPQSVVLSNSAKEQFLEKEGAEGELEYACGVFISGFSGTQDLFCLTSFRKNKKEKQKKLGVEENGSKWCAKEETEMKIASSETRSFCFTDAMEGGKCNGEETQGGARTKQRVSEWKKGEERTSCDGEPTEKVEETVLLLYPKGHCGFQEAVLHGNEVQPALGKHTASSVVPEKQFTPKKHWWSHQLAHKKESKKTKGKKELAKRPKQGGGEGGRIPPFASTASAPQALVAAFSSTDFLLQTSESASWNECESSAVCSVPSFSIHLSHPSSHFSTSAGARNSSMTSAQPLLGNSRSPLKGNSIIMKCFPFPRSSGDSGGGTLGFTHGALYSSTSLLLSAPAAFPFSVEEKSEVHAYSKGQQMGPSAMGFPSLECSAGFIDVGRRPGWMSQGAVSPSPMAPIKGKKSSGAVTSTPFLIPWESGGSYSRGSSSNSSSVPKLDVHGSEKEKGNRCEDAPLVGGSPSAQEVSRVIPLSHVEEGKGRVPGTFYSATGLASPTTPLNTASRDRPPLPPFPLRKRSRPFSASRVHRLEVPNPLANIFEIPSLSFVSSSPAPATSLQHLHPLREAGRASLDRPLTSLSAVIRRISHHSTLSFRIPEEAKQEEVVLGTPYQDGRKRSWEYRKGTRVMAIEESVGAGSPLRISRSPRRVDRGGAPPTPTHSMTSIASPCASSPAATSLEDEETTRRNGKGMSSAGSALASGTLTRKQEGNPLLPLSHPSAPPEEVHIGIPCTLWKENTAKEEEEKCHFHRADEGPRASGALSRCYPWLSNENEKGKGKIMTMENEEIGSKASSIMPLLGMDLPTTNGPFPLGFSGVSLHGKAALLVPTRRGEGDAGNKKHRSRTNSTDEGRGVIRIPSFLNGPSFGFLPSFCTSGQGPLSDSYGGAGPQDLPSPEACRQSFCSTKCRPSSRGSTRGCGSMESGSMLPSRSHSPSPSSFPLLSSSSSLSSRMLALAASLHPSSSSADVERRKCSGPSSLKRQRVSRAGKFTGWHHDRDHSTVSPTAMGDLLQGEGNPIQAASYHSSQNEDPPYPNTLIVVQPFRDGERLRGSLLHAGGRRETEEWSMGEVPETMSFTTRGMCVSSTAVTSPMHVGSTLSAYSRQSLQEAFEAHPLSSTIDFAHAFPLMAVFYTARELLFQPLSPSEQEKITGCLATAFGVPAERLVNYLAVHGTFWYIHQDKELIEALWGEDVQRQP